MRMKIKYDNGIWKKEIEVENFYEDIAKLLIKEEAENCKRVVEITSEYGKAIYQVRIFCDILKIQEIQNSMPEELANVGLEPTYLVKTLSNGFEEYNFFQFTSGETGIIMKYGRNGDKSSMFSNHKTVTIPKRMYWIKKYEKLANGYVDAEQLNFKLRKKMLL